MKNFLVILATLFAALSLLATAALLLLGIYTLFEGGFTSLVVGYLAGILIMNGAIWLANRGPW